MPKADGKVWVRDKLGVHGLGLYLSARAGRFVHIHVCLLVVDIHFLYCLIHAGIFLNHDFVFIFNSFAITGI